MRNVVVLSALALVACGQPVNDTADGGTATPKTFEAVQGDFADFTSWHSFDLGTDMSDGVHSAGRRLAYVKELPPHGSPAFPVGTIIVKAIDWDTPDAGRTFAMVKRGYGYNTQGAPGWEWFELTPGPNKEPIIVWRGTDPPAGENYGSTGVTCNACHAMSEHNDYVPSPELDLSKF